MFVERFAVSARRWGLLALLWYPKFFVRFCSQNFDHCHLFASFYHPLGALRLIAALPSSRRSWKNKLISHNKKKNTNLLVDVFFLVAGVGISSCLFATQLQKLKLMVAKSLRSPLKICGATHIFLTLLQIPHKLFNAIK